MWVVKEKQEKHKKHKIYYLVLQMISERLHPIFGEMPLDIIIQIVEYTGKIKYRNNKFMNQIAKEDERYDAIKNISTFLPIYFMPYSKQILWYERDLGKYSVKMEIGNLHYSAEIIYIFRKKRPKNDSSIYTLYLHELN